MYHDPNEETPATEQETASDGEPTQGAKAGKGGKKKGGKMGGGKGC